MTTTVTIQNPHNFVRLTFSNGETRTVSPGAGHTAYLYAHDRKIVTIEELGVGSIGLPPEERPAPLTLDETSHGHE